MYQVLVAYLVALLPLVLKYTCSAVCLQVMQILKDFMCLHLNGGIVQ